MLRTLHDRESPTALVTSGRRRSSFLAIGTLAVVIGVSLLGWSALATPTGLDRSLALSPQIAVTPQDQSFGAANNTPVLVADPGDERFVVMANRLDAPDYACSLHLSGNGGNGWVPAEPLRKLPDGVEKCYAPEVSIDGLGTIYYLFVGLAGAGNHPVGAFLTTSTDRGRTFSVPHRVLGPENFSVRMAVDPDLRRHGRIHLVWVRAVSDTHLGGFGAPPNPILAAHSDDGGETFSSPVQVSDPERALVNAPALVVGRDHAVHVAYYDLGEDRRDYDGLEGPTWERAWQLVLASSSDGGAHFAQGTVVEPEVIPAERVMLIFTMAPPSLAVDGQRICAAWTDGRNGDSDAYLRCSDNLGRTWRPARRLNDDAIGNGYSQYLPQVALAPGGRVDTVFYDRRRDGHNANADISYTFSVDGGRTFSTNVPLTTEGMSYTEIGQEYAVPSAAGMHEFGSRTALLARRHQTLAAWTDTHNSAPPTRAQDIFASQVTIGPARTHGTRTGAIAGGTLLVVGVGVTAAGLIRRRAQGRSSRSRSRKGTL